MAFNPNASQLSQEQILQQCFDPVNDALRVDAFVQVDTINADLTVDIKAASGDNIAITNQDGSNPLVINPDGSINVDINSVTSATVVNTYGEVLSVASGILTTIVSKTMTNNGRLSCVQISGSNIATYTVNINSITQAKTRTYFGSNLDYFFDFKDGLALNTSDIIQIQVIHNRPYVGDFNARIQTVS